jgi:hypothetical protein
MRKRGSHAKRQETKRLERLWRESQQLESDSKPDRHRITQNIVGYTYDDEKQTYFKTTNASETCKKPINTDIEQVKESNSYQNSNRYNYVYSSIPTLLQTIQLNVNAFKHRSPERIIRGTLFKQKPSITAFGQTNISRITDFSWDKERLKACITYASGFFKLMKDMSN